MKYSVFNGEYPFDQQIGTVHASSPEEALQNAIETFPNSPHPVVSPSDNRPPLDAAKRAEYEYLIYSGEYTQ